MTGATRRRRPGAWSGWGPPGAGGKEPRERTSASRQGWHGAAGALNMEERRPAEKPRLSGRAAELAGPSIGNGAWPVPGVSLPRRLAAPCPLWGNSGDSPALLSALDLAPETPDQKGDRDGLALPARGLPSAFLRLPAERRAYRRCGPPWRSLACERVMETDPFGVFRLRFWAWPPFTGGRAIRLLLSPWSATGRLCRRGMRTFAWCTECRPARTRRHPCRSGAKGLK